MSMYRQHFSTLHKPLWKLHKSNVACNINPPTAKSDKQLISNIKVMKMEEMT